MEQVRGLTVSSLLLILAFACCLVMATAAETGEERFSVERDEESGITTLIVPADDGMVAWSDVIRALARSGRLDEEALQSLPSGQIDLKSRRGRLGVAGLNLLLPPEVTVLVIDRESGRALRITIDEPAMEERIRTVQRSIRERIVDEDGARYGLTLDEDWQAFDSARPLVVLIHGYSSTPESLAELHASVCEAGYPTTVFAYPNDGPIEDSAALLAADLRDFAGQHPAREISIVAHSMGGLVARAVIENPELDPANVGRLIMVATPNQGSQLACLPGGLDACEHLLRRPEDGLGGIFREAATDGFNEACHDMRPGSRFLRELNARQRNPRVRYSLLLGTAGPLTPESLAELQSALHASAARNNLARLLAPRADEQLSDLDEVVIELGDGAVAVERGRLDGVEDTVLLEFSHLTITRATDSPQGRELLNAILSRLEREESRDTIAGD